MTDTPERVMDWKPGPKAWWWILRLQITAWRRYKWMSLWHAMRQYRLSVGYEEYFWSNCSPMDCLWEEESYAD